ncbi:hypothetical protein T07_3594 [Trichinella nelsoni]|uniref:Uncharacterized protein n=1 Tax=Trichinella nelsoni TaxID=6336 RepID=A0A0V0RL15_9BILA|nr:hypothetical protein T07_3594 [Trichinella nelsoni]
MAWLTGFFCLCQSLTLERRRANVISKRTSLCMRNMEKCYASSIFNTSEVADAVEQLLYNARLVEDKSFQKFLFENLEFVEFEEKISFHTEREKAFPVKASRTSNGQLEKLEKRLGAN